MKRDLINRSKVALFFLPILAAAMIFALPGSGTHIKSVSAATSVSSVNSGNWSDPSTWSGASLPSNGDSVAINPGHTVTYDVQSNVVLGEVTVDGTLRFSRSNNTRLKTSNNILVRSGGFLDMGTAGDFIPAGINSEVIFVLPQGYVFTGGSMMAMSDKGIWAMSGSRWEVHGAPLLHTWTKLAADAQKGTSTLIVDHNTGDWPVSSSVIISQTTRSFRSTNKCNHDTPCSFHWENEVRRITNSQPLTGGQTRLTLDQPLQFAHQGTGETRGEVGLLTRNVLIRTEVTGVSDSTLDKVLAERRFAHTMLMGTATGKIQYAEFKYMGHLSTLARYPVHVHMTGTAGNGVVIRGNSVWRSGNRGYQVHNTQGVLLEDNVAFDTAMSPYYIERSGHPGQPVDQNNPNEAPNGNWLVHNLGVQSSNAPTKGSAQQNDDAIIWVDQLDNMVLGNVGAAAGANGGSGDIPQGAEQDFNDGDGLYVDTRADNTGLISPPVFLKNEFHSSAAAGWKFWHVQSIPFDFVDTSVWSNQFGVTWGYYRTEHRMYQVQAIDNGIGMGGRGSSSGSRFVQDVLFKNNNTAILNGTGGPFQQARPTWPDEPFTYVRPVFEGNRVDVKRAPKDCVPGSVQPVWYRSCNPGYVQLISPNFKSSATPFWFVGDMLDGNRNTYWRVYDAQGLGPSFPKDFLLMRQDQQNPGNRTSFTQPLLQGPMSWNSSIPGLVVPIDSAFPNQLVLPVSGHSGSTGGKYNDGVIPPGTTYTFNKNLDLPPEVSLTVSMNGTVATLNAIAADDKAVARVEFWLDDRLIATDVQAPYTASVDLANHPRRYAYLYAKAFDGTIQYYSYPSIADAPRSQMYEQRSYSKVVEIGPEVILGGQTLTPPPPPSNQPPVVSAGSDKLVTMASPAVVSLQGSASDDGLPNPPGSLDFLWSASGPSAVSFHDRTALATTATFFQAGTYVCQLTADDGNSTTSDQVTITVLAAPVLSSISVSPLSASVAPGSSHQFSAQGLDQNGNPFLMFPVWSVSGGGSINQSGLFTAGSSEGGPFTVTASNGSVSGSASVTVSATPAPPPATTAGLVARWALDGGSGSNALDSSQNAFNASLVNMSNSNWVPGHLGSALDFNGSNQFLDAGDRPDFQLSAYSWALWVNADSPPSGSNNTNALSNAGQQFQFNWNHSDASFRQAAAHQSSQGWVSAKINSSLSPNTWYHVAATYDGAQLKVFLNGTLQDSTPGGPPSAAPGSLTIGSRFGGSMNFFDGQIDDVRIYNRALSDQEVASLAGQASAPPPQPANQAPVVSAGSDLSVTMASPATASLQASATDDGLPNPPASLDVSWSASGPAAVSFQDQKALATTATFFQPGTYVLTLTVSDGSLSSSDVLTVTVLAPLTLSSITVSPSSVTVSAGASQQFSAQGLDQHSTPFPTNPSWSVSGGGTINANGLFTAGSSQSGTFTVTATDGSVSGSASVTVPAAPAPTPTPTPTPAPIPSPTSLVVSNLTVASGEAYEVVDGGLTSGAFLYIDRGYKFTSLPAYIEGDTYVKTANDDKKRGATSFLSFDVNQPVMLYIAFDSRARSLPGWLSGWTNLPDMVGTTDVQRRLYRQAFPAGTITLGGNQPSGADSTYNVIIVPN